MSPKEERCVLEGLLKALDEGSKSRGCWRPWLVNLVLWFVTAALFLVVFRYAGALRWPHWLLAGGSFALGVYLAYDFYISMYRKQWPVMAQYVSREQVERRLAELRT